jgi:hypothetical protein
VLARVRVLGLQRAGERAQHLAVDTLERVGVQELGQQRFNARDDDARDRRVEALEAPPAPDVVDLDQAPGLSLDTEREHEDGAHAEPPQDEGLARVDVLVGESGGARLAELEHRPRLGVVIEQVGAVRVGNERNVRDDGVVAHPVAVQPRDDARARVEQLGQDAGRTLEERLARVLAPEDGDRFRNARQLRDDLASQVSHGRRHMPSPLDSDSHGGWASSS